METMTTSVITFSQYVNNLNARMDAVSSKMENLIIYERNNSASIRNFEVKWDTSHECCMAEFKVFFLTTLR